jgi:hypothetical protein
MRCIVRLHIEKEADHERIKKNEFNSIEVRASKVKKMERKNLVGQYRFLMWGGGLILIVVGLGLLLIFSFLIGEPLPALYPYINATVLLILKILGWINLIPGLFLFILGFFAKMLATYNLDLTKKEQGKSAKQMKFLRIFVLSTSVLLLLAFPIGTFVGVTLIRESWILQDTNPLEIKELK